MSDFFKNESTDGSKNNKESPFIQVFQISFLFFVLKGWGGKEKGLQGTVTLYMSQTELYFYYSHLIYLKQPLSQVTTKVVGSFPLLSLHSMSYSKSLIPLVVLNLQTSEILHKSQKSANTEL